KKEKELTADEQILEEINQKIRQDPNNPNFYNQRASYYYKRGKMEEAINDIDRCIKIDSMIPDFYITRGDIHFAQLDAEAAKLDFEKAKKIDPFFYKADLK